MATLLGALLARAGHAVALAGRFEPNLAAIAREGLRVEQDPGAWRAPARALRLGGAALPGADFVLVLVKSYQTADVAPQACRAASRGRLATLQNGLGNREALEACAGAGRVLVGTTTAGATLLGPGRVRGHIVEAQIGTAEDGAAGTLAGLFRGAGLPTRLVPDIDRVLWAKLAVNCAVNPLSALHGVPNGALLQRPDWRETMAAAAREVARVAAGLGVVVEGDAAERSEAVARATASNLSSMLQDLRRGSRTEIDAICGAVVEHGRRLGVPTPVNESLWRAVRAREGRPIA
jgi:2-dehydropantoate 2-reductase